MLKKVPCEECRNQKRRCNGNNPCERCGKLNLTCIYLKNSTPDDDEFIQLAKEAALMEEVAFLEDQLDELGTAVENIKQHQHQQQQQQQHQQQYDRGSTSVGTVTPTMTFDDTENSSVSTSSDQPTPVTPSAQQSTTSSHVSDSPVWTLTVTKGRLCFRTQVKTHGDLLAHAQNLSQVIQLNDLIPSSVHRDRIRGALMESIGMRMLYKSNKSRYKTAHMAFEHLLPWKMAAEEFVIQLPTTAATTTTMLISTPTRPTFTTTLSILAAYIECQHFYHWAIHIPTFTRLFIPPANGDSSWDTSSPALNAFCAVVCTMDCNHIVKVVPAHLLSTYGTYYYEQARLAVADQFDQVSLELVTSYVFMAIYQWYHSNESISVRYCDMAYRMAHLLLASDFDNDYDNDNDDVVHFYRILCYLQEVCAFQQIVTDQFSRRTMDLEPLISKLRRKLPHADRPFSSTSFLLSTPHLIDNEPRFARYHNYRLELRTMMQQAYRFYDRFSANIYELVHQIANHLEIKLRQWHAALDPNYRIPGLPLLDTWAITSDDYMAKLETACTISILPALTTLAIYDELVITGLTALPKRSPLPDDYAFVAHLTELWKGSADIDLEATTHLGVSNIEKWQRRIKKMYRLKEEIQFDGENEDFVTLVQTSFYTDRRRYDFPFLMVALEAAVNANRISLYLRRHRTLGGYCFFDKRIVFGAKALLQRFLIAEDPIRTTISPFLALIYENIALCDVMLYSPLDSPVPGYGDPSCAPSLVV